MTIASPPDLEHLHAMAITARDGLQAFGIIAAPPTPFVQVHHEHLLELLDAANPETIAAAHRRHTQLPVGWLTDMSNAVGELNAALASRDVDTARTHGRTIARLCATAHHHLKEIHA